MPRHDLLQITVAGLACDGCATNHSSTHTVRPAHGRQRGRRGAGELTVGLRQAGLGLSRGELGIGLPSGRGVLNLRRAVEDLSIVSLTERMDSGGPDLLRKVVDLGLCSLVGIPCKSPWLGVAIRCSSALAPCSLH